MKTVVAPADGSPHLLSNLPWEKHATGCELVTASPGSSVDRVFFFFFFFTRVSLLSHSGKFVLAARRGKASPQAKGEKLGYGKKRKSFLEFASRHGNHLYPDSPRRPPSRTATGALDQLTGFLKRTVSDAHTQPWETIKLVTHLFLLSDVY